MSYTLRIACGGDVTDIERRSWGHLGIGTSLLQKGIPHHRHYSRWIRTRTSAELQKIVAWSKGFLDRLAAGATKERLGWLQSILK